MFLSIHVGALTVQSKLLRHMRASLDFEGMCKPLGKPEYERGQVLQPYFYGTGTVSFQLDDIIFSGHHGACAGFRAHAMRMRQLGCGLAILTNSTEGDYLINGIEAWVVGKLTTSMSGRMPSEWS